MHRQRIQLLLILLVVSGALHAFRLSEPRHVVFDEVHFGGFINDYHDGRLFFDIHPPHAKLVIAGTAVAGGYRGDQTFKELGTPIEKISPALLRLAPAIAGTLLPALLFAFLLQLGASPMAAFFGGFAVLLDNALLVQTRLITLDGFLLLAIFGSLTCFLVAFRCEDRLRRTRYAFAAGLLAGLAPGIKITGLATLAVMGLCLAIDFLAHPSWRRLRVGASHSVWILTGALITYAAGWAIHFGLLDTVPVGYRWPVPKGDFLVDMIDIHRTMLSANAGIRTAHPDSSPWWAWLFMSRPIFYWSQRDAAIYLIGNPVLWWGTTLGLVVVAANGVLPRISNLRIEGAKRSWPPMLWIPALGYVVALAPLVPVKRPLFLYHYFTALLLALTTVVCWLDHIGWTRPGGFREQRKSYYAALALLVLGFAAASPFIFSFLEMPEYRRRIIDLLPLWP